MSLDGLKILTKIEELDVYSHQVLIQFPKYEKFVLCAEIRQTLTRIIMLTVRCAKRFYKKTSMQDLDIEVEYLRCLVRKSYRLHYINVHRYKVWSIHINEIGNMLGGWMKTVKK